MKVKSSANDAASQFNFKWDSIHDLKLMHLLDKFGVKCWSMVSLKMKSIPCMQLYYRYKFLKRELIKNTLWNNVENEFLLTKSQIRPISWKNIQTEFRRIFNKYVPIFALVDRTNKLLHENKKNDDSKSVNFNLLQNKRLNSVSYEIKKLSDMDSNDCSLSDYENNYKTNLIEVSLNNEKSYFSNLFKIGEKEEQISSSNKNSYIFYKKSTKPFIINKVPKLSYITQINNTNFSTSMLTISQKDINFDFKEKINYNKFDELHSPSYTSINKIVLEPKEKMENFKEPKNFQELNNMSNFTAAKKDNCIVNLSTQALSIEDFLCLPNFWCFEMFLSIEKFVFFNIPILLNLLKKLFKFPEPHSHILA